MNPFIRLFISTHVNLYKLTGGKVGGRMGKGEILLLTTTGRKTGRVTRVPLLFMAVGDERIIIASAAGGPNHPAWYHNITAKPDRVSVQIGKVNHTLRSRVLQGDEREHAWQQLTASFPNYGHL